MKPPPFEYHAPDSVEEAVDLLAEYGDEAKVLAGGQSLIPLLALRLAHPEHLVDISRIPELTVLDVSDGLRLGPAVRQRAAETSRAVAAAVPLLPTALRHIGHAAIRNRGTIGGSLAHADPAAELPTVLLVLDGEVTATSRAGSRVLSAVQFFSGFLETALSAEEILSEVRLPGWPDGAGWSFREFSRRSGDFALTGVAVVLQLGAGGLIADARIGLSGVSISPVRATRAERSLVGQAPSEELWRAAAAEVSADLSPPSDLHATSNYRRQLAATLSRRALAEAHGRAMQPA